MSSNLRIMIVDDNDQVRLGLSSLLATLDNFSVLAQAKNGRQAIDLVHTKSLDLILMDVGMPVMDGIEACQKIHATHPSVKIIMLTSHDNDEDVFAALASGANGYCLKDTNFDRLVNAIKSVASGDLWLDSQIAHKIASLTKSAKGSGPNKDLLPFQPLSPRELEVLNLVVEGMSNQEIADNLSIGLQTVKTHMKHIMDKLAVSDRTQMAVKALRSGLV